MKWFGATLVFLAEIGMLVGFAWWGFHVADGLAAWAIAAGLLSAVAVVWGTFLSPKALRPPRPLIALFLRIDLLLLGAVAAFASGGHLLSLVTVVFAVVGTVMARGLDRDGSSASGSSL